MIVAAVATIHVGTRPDDIAVNPWRNTIYVTVAGANEVKVISRKTNKVTAAIRVSPSPGSVAVNPRTDTIFMTTYPSHKVAVISGRTNTVTTTIRAGSGLGEIAVNPKTGKAYVTGRGLAPGRDGLTRRSGLRHAELLFQEEQQTSCENFFRPAEACGNNCRTVNDVRRRADRGRSNVHVHGEASMARIAI